MRFETRYDRWIVAILIVIGLLVVDLPLALYLNHAIPASQLWMFLFGPLVLFLALFMTLPQYYELRDAGLFIRQGWRKALLAYSALREVRAANGILSAPVLSTTRIYVSTVSGEQWILAVREQERFLAEIRCHAPQLGVGQVRK